MMGYSTIERLDYYSKRKTNKNLSEAQRLYATERFSYLSGTLDKKLDTKHVKLKSIKRGKVGNTMTIGSLIEALRFKKDNNMNMFVNADTKDLRERTMKRDKLFTADLESINSFMFKSKKKHSDYVTFTN